MRTAARAWIRGGAAGLVIAGLTACASTAVHHPEPPVAPPATWTAVDSTAAGPSSPSAWWLELGGAGLDSLVAEGLNHNHDLTAAAARVRAAQAQARIAGAARWPTVSAGGDAARTQRNFVGFPIGGAGAGVLTTTSNSFGVSLVAGWEVDLWGRLSSEAAAAEAGWQATALDWQAARLSLQAQIVRAWAAATEARLQLELARATAQNLATVETQVEARYTRGLRSSLDVRLARANAAAAGAAVALRQRQHDAVVRQLELLLGRYPAASLQVAADLPGPGAPVPAGLPAELIGRRPDLAAAERRLTAAGLRVSAASRALLPRLSLTGSTGRSTDELGDLLDGDFSVWNLVGNLTVPLFQGGRLRAQVDVAEAGQEAELAAYSLTALRAFGEVESALSAESMLADQEAALDAAVEAFSGAYSSARERYDRGLVDLLTLLDTQRRTYEARSHLLTVRRQRLEARVDLHVALGGDFAGHVPPATTSPADGKPTDG